MKFPGLKRADESFWIRHFHTVLIYGFLLVLCILASILDKNFLTGRNFRALIITALPLMFVSFGQSCAVMTHGLDTSLGAIVSLTNVLTVALMRPGEPFGWVLAVLAGLVAGLLCGALNGVLIAKGGLAPIIATISTTSIFQGLALYISPIPGGKVHTGFARFLGQSFGNIPMAFFAIVLALLVLRFVLNQTPLGKAIRAVGGSEQAAYATGIPVVKTKIIAYSMAGLFGGLAGVYLSAQLYSGDPLIGTAYSLNSITATVAGGTLMCGAVGDTLGIFAGVMIITIINNILNLMTISTFYQYVVQGLILILALSLSSIRKK